MPKTEENLFAGPLELGEERGSGFNWDDTFQFPIDGHNTGKTAVSTDDQEARDFQEMLQRYSRARTLEAVLTQPLQQEDWWLEAPKDDQGQTEWVMEHLTADANQGGMKTPIEMLCAQMTSAVVMRKAYFEKVWTRKDGKFCYDKVAFRPATTCRVRRDPKTAAFQGFEQDKNNLAGFVTSGVDALLPEVFEAPYSFIYFHKSSRDPINGVSDLEIAFWAYKTQQKLLFLWFNYLESQALPRTIVEASDLGRAKQIAAEVAKLQNSGVLPVASGGDNQKIYTLDTSGAKGADPFLAALKYLDESAAASVLANFVDLAAQASSGKGSYALSQDQSDFFLQQRQSVSREMDYFKTNYLIADLVRYNWGPDAGVPKWKSGPLAEVDKDPTINLLTAVVSSPSLNVPQEFVEALATKVAGFLDLDKGAIEDGFIRKQAEAEANAEMAGYGPIGAGVAGVGAVTNAAGSLINGQLSSESGVA